MVERLDDGRPRDVLAEWRQERAPRRMPAPRCAVCGAGTKEGKPVCVRHVLHMPYAVALVEWLEALDRERRLAHRAQRVPWRQVPTLLREVETALQRPDRPAPIYIAKELDVPCAWVVGAVAYLERRAKRGPEVA